MGWGKSLETTRQINRHQDGLELPEIHFNELSSIDLKGEAITGHKIPNDRLTLVSKIIRIYFAAAYPGPDLKNSALSAILGVRSTTSPALRVRVEPI
jgi:hypothetical protein